MVHGSNRKSLISDEKDAGDDDVGIEKEIYETPCEKSAHLTYKHRNVKHDSIDVEISIWLCSSIVDRHIQFEIDE